MKQTKQNHYLILRKQAYYRTDTRNHYDLRTATGIDLPVPQSVSTAGLQCLDQYSAIISQESTHIHGLHGLFLLVALLQQ